MVNTEVRLIIFFAAKDGEALYSQQKQYTVVDVTGDKARSDAVRAILHRNLECQVHESRKIGSGQTRDGKSECRHSRNQGTEMDWNG